jgi:electron transfer flavoprotein alpha subunit
VAELVDKLKNEAGCDLTMAILLIAEHDNSASPTRPPRRCRPPPSPARRRRHVLVAGKGAKAAADAAAKLAGVRKVLLAESDALAERWPSRWPR